MRSCAVGFSAVIFALKVLCTHDTHGVNSFLGLPVPSKYIFWFELVYISLISPNASFVGHLAGILVGLAYIHGPLKAFIDLIEGMVTGVSGGRSHSRRFNSSGTTGNSGGFDEEEVRRATEESLRNGRPPYPTNDDWSSGPAYNTSGQVVQHTTQGGQVEVNHHHIQHTSIRKLKIKKTKNGAIQSIKQLTNQTEFKLN